MNKMSHQKIKKMVLLAILTAIMLIFAFTPLGYLKTAGIEITLMIIPVAIGAILCGPAGGAFLGGVFGITSFIQCFGMSIFGEFLLSLNPWLTFITCMIPRILCGLLSGFIFKALHKIDKTRIVSYFAASLSTALLNTILFMFSIIVFFWHNETFLTTMADSGLPVDSIWVFLLAFVGLNGVIEAIVNFSVGAGISKILAHINKD